MKSPHRSFFAWARLLFLSAVLGTSSLHAAIFSIEDIRVRERVDGIREGISLEEKKNERPKTFVPQIEVRLKVNQEAASKNLVAKAYFYDASGKLLKSYPMPFPVNREVQDGVRGNFRISVWPTVFPPNKLQSVYFPLPEKLPSGWSVAVVFGNANGVAVATVPDHLAQNLTYPEHDLAEQTLLHPDVSLTDIKVVPIIEQVVQSGNPKYPAFTLLMRLPKGVTDPKDVKGVLATCLVANSVGEMRDRLNAINPNDPSPYYRYADEHKLAIIAWGARWVWNSYANFDELDKDQSRHWDSDFETLANAWDKGVQMLVDKYKIPDHNYLMFGFSAGAEWVHRLALHKPDRFLAVHMHISASYDNPTPEASHILWLLTTGELDGGCDNSRRFYKAARALGYPIVFKSIIGLKHAGSPITDQLGIRFFEYAVALNEKRTPATIDAFTRIPPLDVSGFIESPYYGDLMNQEMFAAKEKDMIPEGFLVPLPNKEIADAWNH